MPERLVLKRARARAIDERLVRSRPDNAAAGGGSDAHGVAAVTARVVRAGRVRVRVAGCTDGDGRLPIGEPAACR